MAAPKMLSLFALLTIALSLTPIIAHVPDRAQVARHVHARNAAANRKRDSSSCMPRPSDVAPTTTSPPPPPSTTTPPPAPTTSAVPSSSSRKWCLASGLWEPYVQNFALPQVGYFYNWLDTFTWHNGTAGNVLQAYGMNYMPQLWGWRNAQAFLANVVNGPDNPGGIALSLNEPDIPSQGNISPQDAAAMWPTYMTPLLQKGYKIASPAVVNDQSGADWLNQFFTACGGNCHVDIMAFHAYTTNAQDLIDFASALYQNYSLPVMITEFADQDYSGANNQATMNQVWDFAGQVKDFVNNHDWVYGACPFGLMSSLPDGVNPDNSLLDAATNGPNSLAYFYFT